MKAVVVRAFGGPEALITVEVPTPIPGPGEVLVKVEGAGVNPADALVRMGAIVEYGAAAAQEQFGLGADLAGTVESIGEGVRGLAPRDAVIGLQERQDLPLAAYAEYVALEDWALASAPGGASMVEAATLPLNATTADQALDALDLGRGQWLLITGAAGGVGGFAIELAKLRGLCVIGQARPGDEELVRGLGAELFVSRDAALSPTVRGLVPGGVNGALDAANVGVAAMDAVAHGGAYASLLNASPQARRAIRTHNIAYYTDGPRLAALSALAGAGHLTLRVAETFALADASQAHERMAAGANRGRLVLVP